MHCVKKCKKHQLKYIYVEVEYHLQGFCLSFLTQLDRSSHPVVQKLVCQYILGGNVKCLKQVIFSELQHFYPR